MAGNTLTDVQIFNRALLRLGETKPVTAVDGSDTTKYGTIAGSEYYPTRDEEFRAHMWKFAIKRMALSQAYATGIASWSGSALSMTVLGVTIITFTANTASAAQITAGLDLPCRTLSSVSIPPNPAWLGQNISGTGIPSDTIVRNIDYLHNTIQLSRPVTVTGTAINCFLVPMRVGWMVTSSLVPGNVLPSYPTGIAQGTVITAITAAGSTVTLSLSMTTTGAGSSQSIAFQAQNQVGYWYMYNEPADSVRDLDVYVILPTFVYLWPWKVVHQNSFPSRHEGQYIYTDLDPNNGNPYAAYIAEITDYSLYDQLFVDMFTMRLASKICFYVNGGDKLKAQFEQEYMNLATRAQIYNLEEMDMQETGNTWWTDRELP